MLPLRMAIDCGFIAMPLLSKRKAGPVWQSTDPGASRCGVFRIGGFAGISIPPDAANPRKPEDSLKTWWQKSIEVFLACSFRGD